MNTDLDDGDRIYRDPVGMEMTHRSPSSTGMLKHNAIHFGNGLAAIASKAANSHADLTEIDGPVLVSSSAEWTLLVSCWCLPSVSIHPYRLNCQNAPQYDFKITKAGTAMLASRLGAK